MRLAVKERREEAGLSREELSKSSGVSLDVISDMETNKRIVYNSKDISKIAAALNISVEKIFFNQTV